MALLLTITSYHKITPGQCSEKQLDNGVLTIGRGSENDWVLPDPERLVSSRHCSVQFKNGHYYLTDNSTNGVELVRAGVRLQRGNSERLEDGEVIRLGEYEILVKHVAALPGDGFGAAQRDTGGSFEALLHGGGGREPAMLTPGPGPAIFQGGSALDTKPDLFDFLSPRPVPPATQPDHVPADRHDFRAPSPLATQPPISAPVASPAGIQLIPEDWDLLADLPVPPPLFQPPAPLPEQPQPLVVEAPPIPPAPIAVEPVPLLATPVTPFTAPASLDLLQAFLRGAGLEHLRIDAADAAAQMESIGRSYRLMVEGLIDVLRARSSLKGEFRMAQTTIQPVENNPLKFAPNADEALLLLLRHGNHAFMAPDQAVADSFDDLKAHQLAVMAGVEAALKHLIGRFEPARLQDRLAKPGGLGGLFGASRPAQNWQRFTELYASISQEAAEDFQDLFGREFSHAYEQHCSRFRRP